MREKEREREGEREGERKRREKETVGAFVCMCVLIPCQLSMIYMYTQIHKYTHVCIYMCKYIHIWSSARGSPESAG